MLILEYINYACLFLSLSLYISSRLFKISYDLTSIFLFNTYQIDTKTMYDEKYIFISSQTYHFNPLSFKIILSEQFVLNKYSNIFWML